MGKNHQLKTSFIYSLSMFVVAYYLLQLNNQLLTISISKDFYVDIQWFFSHLVFEPTLTAPWVSSDMKTSLTMAGPIVSLLLGLVILFLYLNEKTGKKWLSFLLFWGFIHAFNNFFGVLGMSIFVDTPLVVASQMYNTGLFTEAVFTTAGLYLLFLIGINSGSAELIKNGNSMITSRRDRFYFMAVSILLPLIAGSSIIFLLNRLNNGDHFIQFLSIIVLGIPAFFMFYNQTPESRSISKKTEKIHWGIVLVSIIFVAGYFLLTKNGIKI